MPPLIRLEQACITKQDRPVLADVTLTFEAAGTYAVLGPSGAGKTSLLRLLNRLQDPTRGCLWYRDTPYVRLPVTTLRRRVAMVFQVPVVFAGSVRDNLLLPVHLHWHRQPAQPQPDLARALDLAGLPAAALERDAASLSVGEKQRVCIARALLLEPEALLLDEPTAALDPTTARRLLEGLAVLNRQTGVTLVLVSHQPEQARLIGGRIILLVGGRVAEHSGAEQFFARPATEIGRRYLDQTLPGAR